MRKFSVCLLFFFCVASLLAQKPVVVIGAKMVSQNVSEKYKLPVVDHAIAKPDLTRGQCCLNINNQTGYFVDVWVNEEYIGRVSPNGTSDLCMVNDWTNWHAETTGKTFEWSGDGVCDGEYVIRIE